MLSAAGCAEPALTDTEYRDLVSVRAAAHAEEVEEVRSSHLFQLERAVDDLVRQLDGDALESAVITETAQGSAALFSAITDAVAGYAADLGVMSPPEEMRPAHDEYVASLELSVAGIDATLEQLADASSFADIDAAIGGSTLNDTQHRVDAACRSLESVLIAQGVGANLQCREA